MSTKRFRTTCARDCPDACGIIATVEEGRIVDHRGDPDHPITRGFLCKKGNSYLKRFYDPQRLKTPLRRSGAGWRPVPWDDALDLIAEKLVSYRTSLGPRSVLVVNYSGMRGLVSKLLGRLFWAHYGGPTFAVGGLSVEADDAAQALDFGGPCTHDPEDLAHSSAFVVWGKNVAVTRQHWMPFIQKARRRGAILAVIDPVRSATAERAERFYQIRPGSDGFLALAVARLLIERDAVDRDFISCHSNGFEAYRRLAFSRSLEEYAAATDLTLSQIAELAELYASIKPLATLVGLGPGYWTNSGATVRLIDALGAATGNVGVSGGGVHADISGYAGLDFSVLKDAPPVEGRKILVPRLGAEILAAADPPLKMGWIAGANPAASAPDTNRVRQGLASLDFLVVVDQFMTATAELADVVLPCTTYLEMDDLVASYGHHFLGLTRRGVPPLGEARSDAEIVAGLAGRLGFGHALAGTPDDWMRRLLAPLAEDGLTLERLQMEGACRNPRGVRVPYHDRCFATPSGRYEFVTSFEAPEETDGLHLVATKTLHMINLQVLPEHLPGAPVVRVHPEVLARAGLADECEVWVASAVGRVRARAVGDEGVRRDVLLFNPAMWKGDLSGVNQLREAHLTDLGDAAAMHATKVTLSPVS